MTDANQQEFDFSTSTPQPQYQIHIDYKTQTPIRVPVSAGKTGSYSYIPIPTPQSWTLAATTANEADEVPPDEHDYSTDPNDEMGLKPIDQEATIARRVAELTEALYDLHKNPNHDRDEAFRLLEAYRVFTGKDKPGFML